jgi:hypothetical protein
VPSKIKKSSSSWGGSRPGAGRPRKTDAKAHAFEAAMPSLNRGFVTFQVLNPRNEVSPWTRTEMLKLSRWLYMYRQVKGLFTEVNITFQTLLAATFNRSEFKILLTKSSSSHQSG